MFSIILSFLQKEGPSDKVDALLAKLSGASELVGGDTEEESGGLLGGLGGMMGGGAMAALGKLQGLGLGMGEIQGVTKETVSYAKEQAGDDLVDEIVGSIPGLSQII